MTTKLDIEPARNLQQLRVRADRIDHVLDWCDAGGDSHETLIDLLADAMHWCDFRGEDFFWCLTTGCTHYHTERFAEPLNPRKSL